MIGKGVDWASLGTVWRGGFSALWELYCLFYSPVDTRVDTSSAWAVEIGLVDNHVQVGVLGHGGAGLTLNA